ncbi:MAG: hypothetical protein WCF85_04990 [Rhodospirillaceae bacterium]
MATTMQSGSTTTAKWIELDNWILIPIANKSLLLGQEIGTKNYRVTSEVVDLDGNIPPRWAITKSESRYVLYNRATHISRYAYVTAMDTLLQRKYAAENAAHFMKLAEKIIIEYNAGKPPVQ